MAHIDAHRFFAPRRRRRPDPAPRAAIVRSRTRTNVVRLDDEADPASPALEGGAPPLLRERLGLGAPRAPSSVRLVADDGGDRARLLVAGRSRGGRAARRFVLSESSVDVMCTRARSSRARPNPRVAHRAERSSWPAVSSTDSIEVSPSTHASAGACHEAPPGDRRVIVRRLVAPKTRTGLCRALRKSPAHEHREMSRCARGMGEARSRRRRRRAPSSSGGRSCSRRCERDFAVAPRARAFARRRCRLEVLSSQGHPPAPNSGAASGGVMPRSPAARAFPPHPTAQ